jgi:NitT/TauT family transport system permease protein
MTQLRPRFNLQASVLFIFAILLWEASCRLHWIPEFLFPPPSQVLASLSENRSEFQTAFFQTLKGTLLGFFFSLVLGTLIAMIFSLTEFLKKAMLPFAVFFQTIPIIAVAPLLVIYFGFGMPTVVAASFIVSLFPVIANTLQGLESVDPGALELFKLYGATPWKILLKLKLPTAYPMMYAGWKSAIGLAIIGAIAGEFVAGGGLGAMIDSARTQQRIEQVFGALFLLSLMGLGLITLLKLFHRTLQNHRPYGLHLKE